MLLPEPQREDFCGEDTISEIAITVTFGDLTEEESGFFKAYLQGGGPDGRAHHFHIPYHSVARF